MIHILNLWVLEMEIRCKVRIWNLGTDRRNPGRLMRNLEIDAMKDEPTV
jgi:hypothetical protein